MFSNNLTKKCFRDVPGKNVLVGVERNLKMGVPPAQFYLFNGIVHMDIPGNTPTHRILTDSSSPHAVLPGTAFSRFVF